MAEEEKMRCLLHPEVKMDVYLSEVYSGDFFQDVRFRCPEHNHGYVMRIRMEDLLPDTRSLPGASFEEKHGKSLEICEEGAYEGGPC